MAGLLFAANAPITFLLSLIVFNESHKWTNFLGVFAVTTGVFIAISARGKAGKHSWETSIGNTALGISAGFGAAVCQSLGALLIVTLLREGQNPIIATMLRVWVAVAFLSLSLLVPAVSGGFIRYKQLTWKLTGQIAISGILGMGIGMSLYLVSISLAPVGIATILSATTPIVVLPVLWLTTGERPSMMSLIAAFIVVIGTYLIFMAD
jgi:drug/metabolite transporter (DMT)-like permease